MTRETKAGLVVSCSFLCLVGIVVFGKLNEQRTNGNSEDAREAVLPPEEPRPVSPSNPAASAGNAGAYAILRAGEQQKTDGPGLVPADYREVGKSNPILPPSPASKEPAAKEPSFVPSPAGKSPSEAPVPNALVPSTQAAGSRPEKDAPLAANQGAGPDVERNSHGDAHSPSSEGTAALPTAEEPKERNKPGASGPRKEPPTPGALLAGLSKSGTNAAVTTPAADVSPTPGKGSGPSESAGRDARPAMPLPMPADNAPSLMPFERSAPPKSGAGDPFPVPTAPSSDLAGAETPKHANRDAPAPGAAKEHAIADSMPEPDPRPPARSQPESPKPALQMPEAPPSLSSAGPSPKAALPWSDKDAADRAKSNIAPPVDPRPAPVSEHNMGASGGEPQASGPTDSSPRLPARASPSSPTNVSAVASPSSDIPARSSTPSVPPASFGVGGSSDGFRTRPDSRSGSPALNAPSVDREKASLSETSPLRSTLPSGAIESGMDRGPQPGTATPAPVKSNPLIPTPAPPPSGLSSEQHSPTPSLPPLGAPPSATSRPVAAPALLASTQGSSRLGPLVESYDEDTYTAKANDTFALISQQYYHTDQYERALLLFNRNHPLATSSLRQDQPVLQAGQPVYIPPARILEKYYGAPQLDSAPGAPSAAPLANTITRPYPTSPAPQGSTALVAAGPPVKIPPPKGMPLYRVHEGGEMMWEIANRTLGSGDRWTDILRLNPRFDSKEMIPGGSLLRLPRDARVDPQDVP